MSDAIDIRWCKVCRRYRQLHLFYAKHKGCVYCRKQTKYYAPLHKPNGMQPRRRGSV